MRLLLLPLLVTASSCGLLFPETTESVARATKAAADTAEVVRDMTIYYVAPFLAVALGAAGEWLRRKVVKRRAAKCKAKKGKP